MMAHDLRRLEPEPGLLARMIRAWDRFFFVPADPTPLAMVRICGGLLILYVHLTYSFDLQTFVGEHGMVDLATVNDIRHDAPTLGAPITWPTEFPEPALPLTEEELRYAKKWDLSPEQVRQVVAKGTWKWSLWFHVTDPTWMAILHGGILLAMFCLTVGFCTRIAAVLSWLGMLSYAHRSPVSLFGMDAMMSLVTLYLMIGPSGAALSVDRWLARRRAHAAGDLADPVLAAKPVPLASASLAMRLLQVNLCMVYFASGISKLQGTTWWMGTAVWGTMANYEFSPMGHYDSLYMDFLRFLARRRWLWELFMTGSTAFTLAFEMSFLFLVWLRSWRWVMMIAAVFLHLGIAFFMGLVGFSTVMIVMVLSFVPADAYYEGFERLRRSYLGTGDQDPPAATPIPRTEARTKPVRLNRSA